jgi:general stress protein 26
MLKPEPVPTGDALRDLALKTIQDAKFPVVASMDGDQPRVRPVSPVRTDGFTIFVASLRSSHKTGELEKNEKVELCYLAENHDQVRITGIAERVTDHAVLQDIWDGDPLLRRFLGTIDNPEFILYKMIPHRVRFMREWALEYHDVAM